MHPTTGISATASQSQHANLTELAELFLPNVTTLGNVTPVGHLDLPPNYATLLAHQGHMTVTLEAYHESLVDVRVVAEQSTPTWYARQSLLARHSDGSIVQCGIMKIDTADLPPPVRSDIENHAAPLGRILIRNNLLREVELHALWKIDTSAQLANWLECTAGETVYGRSAAIRLEGHRAVDLLEIVIDRNTPA